MSPLRQLLPWPPTFGIQQPRDPQPLGDLEGLLQVLPVTLDLHPLHVHQIWPARHAPKSQGWQTAQGVPGRAAPVRMAASLCPCPRLVAFQGDLGCSSSPARPLWKGVFRL